MPWRHEGARGEYRRWVDLYKPDLDLEALVTAEMRRVEEDPERAALVRVATEWPGIEHCVAKLGDSGYRLIYYLEVQEKTWTASEIVPQPKP